MSSAAPFFQPRHFPRNPRSIAVTKLALIDPRKVALARLLWRGTTVSQVWLAERLAMRSAANVSQQLRRMGTQTIRGKVPKSLATFLERATDHD